MKATRDEKPEHYAVKVSCERCGMSRDVDLDQIIAKRGPAFSIVNKRYRCKLTKGCGGWNRFFYQSGVMRPLWDDKACDRWFEEDQRREAAERVARKRVAAMLEGREVRFDPPPPGIDQMLWAVASDDERKQLIRRARG